MSGCVSILYFAWVRERIGIGEERYALPEGVTTLGGLVTALRGRGPQFAAAFAGDKLVRAAVNQDFAGDDAVVRPGDEIAFFPPVTGG